MHTLPKESQRVSKLFTLVAMSALKLSCVAKNLGKTEHHPTKEHL